MKKFRDVILPMLGQCSLATETGSIYTLVPASRYYPSQLRDNRSPWFDADCSDPLGDTVVLKKVDVEGSPFAHWEVVVQANLDDIDLDENDRLVVAPSGVQFLVTSKVTAWCKAVTAPALRHRG
jgi:hypothetical protein